MPAYDCCPVSQRLVGSLVQWPIQRAIVVCCPTSMRMVEGYKYSHNLYNLTVEMPPTTFRQVAEVWSALMKTIRMGTSGSHCRSCMLLATLGM